MTYVIDAYAWVEYFKGSDTGNRVREIVEKNETHTNTITIAEVASHFERNEKDFRKAEKILLSLTKPFLPNETFASEAGKLHANIRKERTHMSLADVFVLLTARKLGGKVVTGDEDFRGLKEAVMIK